MCAPASHTYVFTHREAHIFSCIPHTYSRRKEQIDRMFQDFLDLGVWLSGRMLAKHKLRLWI